ncbi:uncharacterized protein LOC110119209 isoform X3 [Bombus terrestris]|uniref:Uncharacterized protein LOC110119209 isoform X3 n=1 Tax=Bombus terrestris TaxID=30195 RepID=A0A9B7CWD6_BOMTE|nr:uncharacterized protein LOC110119209 isoform X3 [Bombus terrestris]
MCSCNKQECTDDFVSLSYEPELSSQEASWHTPVDQIVEDSYDEYCSPACATPVTPRTPVSTRREFRTPAAPLRVLSQRRDLRQGVAVASRRLNYDTIAAADITFDSLDTDDSTGSSQRILRGMFRCAPSSTLQTLPTPQTRTEKLAQTSYRLRTRPLPPERQYLPRITKMTPCGKCLRI